MKRSSDLLGRLSGLAVILGGLLWALGAATALNHESLGIAMRGPHLVLTAAGLLSLIGLARLASHGSGAYGRTGMTGLLVASAGLVLVIASKNLPSSVSEESAWALFDAGGLLLVAGSLLFGTVAWYRKAWFFGAPSVAIAVLGILQLVFLMGPFAETAYLGTVVLPILIGLAWTVLGYALWSYEAKPFRHPRTAHVNDSAGLDGAADEATESLLSPP